MNLAIIPARGGSERIPRKNIKIFMGRPMISYAIDTALSCNLFEHIVVSTDDLEVAKIASKYGADVPFLRPGFLSTGAVDTVSVVAHAIVECRKLGWKFENVCCIYPCTPFLELGDLIEGYNLHMGSGKDYCFPVAEYHSLPQRALKFQGLNDIMPLYPEYEQTRTQDLESLYYDAGQFYWGRSDSWLAKKSIHSHAAGFKVPNWRAIDIDNYDDWQMAEILAKLKI